MKAPVKVCAITSTRADWGGLSPLLAIMRDDPYFDVHVIITGQHLIPSAGNTGDVVINEGFRVAASVPIGPDGDSAVAVTIAAGKAIDGIGAALGELKPDLLILLGDRYETLSAAIAATFHKIPIAHLSGGDVTLGAVDQKLRDAISSLSHLHFVTTEDAARRLISGV